MTKNNEHMQAIEYLRDICGGTCSIARFDAGFGTLIRSELFGIGIIKINNIEKSISLTKVLDRPKVVSDSATFTSFLVTAGCPQPIIDSIEPEVFDLIDAYGRANFMAGKLATVIQIAETLAERKG